MDVWFDHLVPKVKLNLGKTVVVGAHQMPAAPAGGLGFSPAARLKVQTEPEPPPPASDAWASLRRFPVIAGGKKRA